MKDIKSVIQFYKENGVDLQYVPELDQKVRMGICKGCPNLRPVTRTCKECNCFMPFKTKLLFDPVESHKAATKTQTKCPIGLW